MASLFSLLSTARDGIFATTGAMNVTSQNVSGAQTPGYVRRAATIESSPGGGVLMTGVTRSFDRFTYSELSLQQAHLSAATSRASALANLETIVTPTGDTISDRANSLMDAVQQLAANPADLAVRSTVLSKAQSLATGFADTASNIGGLRNELYAQAQGVADEVNSRLDQLGALDAGITSAEAVGGDASDLRDRREQLASDITSRVGGRLLENKDGSITLFGPGGVLYEGGRAAKLSVGIATSGSLVVSSTRNDSTSDITSAVVSGTLGGIVEARDVSATATLKQLDSLAADIATAFNGVHATGFGLDGVSGRNLFATTTTAAGMALDPILLDHPERLAMASTSGDLPGGNDTAVAMAALATASLGGAGTIAERFGQIANKVGAARSNADGDQKLREDTVSTATSLRESASGVSTDEEMVTLQQFQRGFEAASKVLKTVSDLFDTLMSLR